jgi:hypothetical protein
MEKVVHLFDTFKPIFYLIFSEHEKISFGSIKFGKILNVFEPFKFENGLNRLTPLPETIPGPYLAAPTSPVQACLGRSHNMATPPAHAHHSRAGAGLTPPLSGQAPPLLLPPRGECKDPPPHCSRCHTSFKKCRAPPLSVSFPRTPFLLPPERDEAPPLPTASCPRRCRGSSLMVPESKLPPLQPPPLGELPPR